MANSDREIWTKRAFNHWRSAGFPYPTLAESELGTELERLKRVGARQLGQTLTRPSTVGLRLANSCHPQMWQARVRGRSPLASFESDPILYRSLVKAIHFWPDRRCWNARCVRILMSIQNRARVSNFRPTVARALIDTLSTDGDEILDFSAGYGGRLLGAATLHRKYVGIDPAAAQCDGLRRLSSALGAMTEIRHGCAEDVLPEFTSARFDLVFSSPPYFRLERYSEEESQSYKRYPDYRRWLRGFLRPVLEQSHRVLRRHGQLALNIQNVTGYKIAEDALSIALPLFGAPERVYHLAMSTNPADKARRGNFLRTEPIFVFRK
jgi:SAM-dependent methyltransferase